MDTDLEGRCRCGRVTIRITAPPLLAMACHCTGCQRMSASAFSLSVAIPSEGFAVTRGDTVIGGLHGATAAHHFCGWCMTWMFTRPAGMDRFVNVRTAMLDAAGDFPPFVETYADEKLPWATTPARHSYGGLPAMAEYEALIEAYRAAST